MKMSPRSALELHGSILREIPAAKWQNALMVLCHWDQAIWMTAMAFVPTGFCIDVLVAIGYDGKLFLMHFDAFCSFPTSSCR